MLTDFFKPAWRSSSVETRLKAISEMDSENSEHQKILTQLAADDDVSICMAAIQKLSSAVVLHEMSIKHSSDSVRAEAEKRLNELMSEKGSLNKDQYRDLLNRYPELTVRIAAHAELASVRTETIASLSTSQLLEVLDQSDYTDSRQLVAERLINIEADIEALESARKVLRGKDKNAERILKAKIDEVRRQQRQHAENLATVEKLCEEIEYLASRDWRSEFKAKLQVNRKQWDQLDFEIDPDSNQRYQSVRKIVDARFEEQNMIEQTFQSQQQMLMEIEDFLRNIKGSDLKSFIDRLSETLSRQDQFDSSWQQLTVKIQPDLVTLNQYDRMLSAIQSATRLVRQAADILQDESFVESDKSEDSGRTITDNSLAENSQQLNAALKKLKWPSDYGELQAAAELQAQLTNWHNAQKTSAAERQQKLDLLHKKISSIFRFSRAGNLARAKQLCERVERGLNQFEGKDRLVLEERLEEARKTLGDMGDWKNFATEPKYIELCEAMELLATSKQHPDKLSSEMKALQQHWKKLGNSDISEQYWPRFKQAADKVYQPCAEFFDKRHKIRKTHLEQRQQYVEQMRELLEATDWDNDPDYKAVQSAVRSISDHFAGIKDVERGAGQKQWKQFSKFKDAVFAKLDIVYEANINLKRELIKQTEALAEAEAKEENLAKLKSLQTRWKQIGITRRKEDQKAWTEFKKQGDLVYDKVQELRQGKREKTDQQINAYRDIIKDIKKLASTAKDLAEADQLFTALQAKYTELPELQLPETHGSESNGPDSYRSESHRPESRRPQTPGQLPEKLAEGIQRDYRKACDQFDECRSRIINNKHVRQIDALRQKADLCALQEALGASPSEEQLQEISQQWDAIDLHDSVLSRRIEKRRNSAQAAIDRVAITAERRMLCIQLEIAAGTESPAEDKALRMQYQLEQMNKSGLGQQTVNSSEQLENMELDWLCMPGAEPEQQKALDERFQRALRAE
jgi:exonuclease SbcC